jgi:hypothetical protein
MFTLPPTFPHIFIGAVATVATVTTSQIAAGM